MFKVIYFKNFMFSSSKFNTLNIENDLEPTSYNDSHIWHISYKIISVAWIFPGMLLAWLLIKILDLFFKNDADNIFHSYWTFSPASMTVIADICKYKPKYNWTLKYINLQIWEHDNYLINLVYEDVRNRNCNCIII